MFDLTLLLVVLDLLNQFCSLIQDLQRLLQLATLTEGAGGQVTSAKVTDVQFQRTQLLRRAMRLSAKQEGLAVGELICQGHRGRGVQ